MPTDINTLLKTICDPILGMNLDELGIKTELIQQGNHLSLQLLAGFPVEMLKHTLLPAIQTALHVSNSDLAITITLDAFIKAHRTQLLGKALRGVKNTIAIASGKGGVGKSTVAINLATALAKAGAKVGILDADIYGPSIPLMLGEHAPVQISGEHYLPVKAHGIEAMSIGYLMGGDQALIWRGPMLAKSLIQMIDITLWGDLDYLFIDLPPGTGDIQLSLVQKIPLTAAIVVTTPQNVATLDAQKAIKMFQTTGIDVLGVIENMSTHQCNHCHHEEALFGEGGGQTLCDSFTIPLLGQLPLASPIRSQSDEGIPIATQEGDLAHRFMKIALLSAIALGKKPLNYAGKFPPVRIE